MNILNKVTMKVLGKNRTRTAVTIIGIILSAAMITAVVSGVTSIRYLIRDVEIASDGDWYGRANAVDKETVDKAKGKKEVENAVYLENVGYAKLEGSKNEYKPYLFIAGMSDNFKNSMPVNITSGRLPKSADEIIVPEHLYSNGGVKFRNGQKLSLSVGKRTAEGIDLGQNTSLMEGEELNTNDTKEYTVVGFYERESFESYSAPGYTALTVSQNRSNNYDVFIKTKNPKAIYSFMKDNFDETKTKINTGLLRALMASNGDDEIFKTIYGLAGILLVIIVFGSISLIYNSFSMSVSERTKQFGLLSSIGATKKQIRKSVTFEALYLSAIGIPIGILSGLLGLGITFRCIGGLIDTLNAGSMPVKLRLHFTWISIVSAVVIGLVTVLISAFIPSRRATKMSAIEAIRQSNDIKIKGKKVKTSKLTYKLFGLEGMLSAKNFKRNKRKYRATVVSLFMSVVLFITASSFATYLKKTTDAFTENENYEIAYTYTDDEAKKAQIFESMSQVDGVKESGYANQNKFRAEIDSSVLTEESRKILTDKNHSINPITKQLSVDTNICFVEDSLYTKYLSDQNLKANEYMDKANPKALVYSRDRFFASDEKDSKKRYDFHLVDKDTKEMTLYHLKEMDAMGFNTVKQKDGKNIYVYNSYVDDSEKEFSEDEVLVSHKVSVGKVVDSLPFVIDNYNDNVILMYPYSLKDTMLNEFKDFGLSAQNDQFYFKSNDAKTAYNNMLTILNNNTMRTQELINYNADKQSSRALIILLNVFSYGFIVLISLIAIANVFNTISTNILLRRREFAMLKSVGMTRRGFDRMMNFECILYGIKGLIYGIPVAIGLSYLMFKSVSESFEASFFIPWQSILISVASVFLVVFITMIYAMSKIKKDNPIDALKNENL